MKSAILILVFFLIAASQVMAQEKRFKKVYVNHTEVGGLFGRIKYGGTSNWDTEVTDTKLSLTMQMFNGVQLSNRLYAGATVAVDWYKTALINPIAAGARYDLVGDKSARLYATADVGYGFAWLHDDLTGYETKGGLMLNPGFGMKYGKPGKSAFTIALTYKRQEVNVSKPPLNGQTERFEERVYNRMALRLGMIF